jgi:hypothetical protein
MRYVIRAEWIRVLNSHGPWLLNLDNLEYGISQYEGSEVILTGVVLNRSGRIYLKDGDSSIELRSGTGISEGYERSFLGTVEYDSRENLHYLVIKEEAS